MNDVAREADVALKTVSRFVNGETNIAPALAERIDTAIRSLGYRRNLAAASIRPGQRSQVLGLVIGDISNPFYAGMTSAVERAAREQGCLLISASSEESGETHDRIVRRLLDQRVDGLIVVPPREPGLPWEQLDPAGVPVVFVDRPNAAANSDAVLADNRGGAREAVAALIAGGSNRVAFLGDKLDIFTMAERLRGYSEALADAGLFAGPVSSTIHGAEDAAREVRELLAGDDPPAIFAANNRAALGALMAFSDVGRRVPLVGFDDFEAARLGRPAVSVVQQDVAAMGARAVELLAERIADPELPARQLVLPTRLVLRGSERTSSSEGGSGVR